jgi:Zn-dependent metalloprotease
LAAGARYSDVPPGHWASAVIERWSGGEYAVLRGDGDGSFAPSRGLTLGELATVLSKTFGYTARAPVATTPAWADEAVEKAVAAGVFDSAAAIDASVPVTREQAIRYIAIAYGTTPEDGDTTFADDASIGAAYKPYVNAFQKRGFIVGKGNNAFDPRGFYTRAEAMQVIDNTARALPEIPAKPELPDPTSGPAPDPARPDNLTDDRIDLGDIEEAVFRGEATVMYGDDGRIAAIDGAFTRKIVRSAEDAASVLNAASSLFGPGFRADASNIDVRSLDVGLAGEERFYRCGSKVKGIPVLGGQVILVTDGGGSVTGLFGTYDSRIEAVDTAPRLAAEQANRIAVLALLTDPDISASLEDAARALPAGASALTERLVSLLPAVGRLLVHAADAEKAPALVYGVTVRNPGSEAAEENDRALLSALPYFDRTYYIYANGGSAGGVFAVVSNLREADWRAATDTARDMKGGERTMDVQRLAVTVNDLYRMKDTVRDVTTYEVTYSGLFDLGSRPIFSEKIVEKDPSGWDEMAVYAHANMEMVYDFYKNTLKRDSYDGYGAPVSLNVDLVGDRSNRKLWWTRNAFWDSSLRTIVFGNEFGPAADVMAHEFTHAVIDFAVPDGGLYYACESGGLNEAYADIMGNFAENKTDDGRWLIGEDSMRGVIRSFSDPLRYFQIEHYSAYNNTMDVHRSSGIFNFAAYKMMTDARTASISSNTWAKVFYNSLFRLPADASFLLGRGAVLGAAKSLGFDGTEQQAIKDAFDAVGISESKSVRIVLRWGDAPQDLDSHLVGPTGIGKERFHVYFMRRDCFKNGDARSMADLDYDDSTAYGPEITTIRTFVANDDYFFYVHDYTNGDDAAGTALASSGATVNVYRGANNTPIAVYGVDPSSVGTVWNVFKLTMDESENITLTPIDTYGSSPTLQ